MRRRERSSPSTAPCQPTGRDSACLRSRALPGGRRLRRRRWHAGGNKPLRHAADLQPPDFPAGFPVNDRDIIAASVADADVLAVGREGHPIRPAAGGHTRDNLLRFDLIDIQRVVQKARDPQFLLIGTERSSVGRRVDGLVGVLMGLGMLGGHLHPAHHFLFRDIHDSEAVKVAQSHVHGAPVAVTT